jgi:hypothetical protein
MPRYQIGTDEPRGVVGSRRAESITLLGASVECQEYSRYRHIKRAWLREVNEDGTLGRVLATFVNGRTVL